jgi:copper chaperone CopZ
MGEMGEMRETQSMGEMGQIKDVTLSAPDVSCQHCVNAIAQALGGLAGIAQAQTDLTSKTVRVRFDPQSVSLDRIMATLDEAGYPVTKTASA